METAEEQARFYSIQELLDYAFRGETLSINPKVVDTDYKRDFGALSPQEVIADAAMIRSRAMRNIDSEREWHSICAQYRRATDSDLRDKEAYTIFVLVQNIRENCRLRNHLAIADMIRDWSPNMRPTKSIQQWADKLNIPFGTVRRWTKGLDQNPPSIHYQLDDWRTMAEKRLSIVFTDLGLIEP
jgi:hypothetical protein